MIKVTAQKCGSTVTEMTIQRGGHVIHRLTWSDITVVTGGTVVHYTGMIVSRTDECSRGMTHHAILIGRHMVG